jgi:hypothetical protein
MEQRHKHMLLILSFALALWTVGRATTHVFLPDSTMYMVETLHYAGIDYATACRTVYTSPEGITCGWDQGRIEAFRDEKDCLSNLRIYKRRILYPLVSSLVWRATGSWDSMGFLPLISFAAYGLALYLLFSYTMRATASLFYSLVLLSLPMVLFRAGLPYVIDGFSLAMWLLCTIVYYRNLKYGRGLAILYPMLLTYLLAKETVLFLVPSFILTSLALKRYREAAILFATVVALAVFQQILSSAIGAYNGFDTYLYTFYENVPNYYVRPTVPVTTLITTHIRLMAQSYPQVAIRLLYHTNIFLFFAALGFLLGRKDNLLEHTLFTAQFLSNMLMFAVLPLPDSRYLIFSVPAILYMSYLGWKHTSKYRDRLLGIKNL